MRLFTSPKVKDDCIIFSGFKQRNGYGRMTKNQKSWMAHRWVYTQTKGTIPEGMYVMHTCDNPSCINPEHLFVGTPSDNVQDMLAKRRGNPARGEKSGMAKLSEYDVKLIRLASFLGCHRRFLAQAYGMHRHNVTAITHRRTWKHVS